MASYLTGLSTIYNIKKRGQQLQFTTVCGSSEIVNDLLKQQTLKLLKLVQLDNEMCKWFAAVHSEANLVITGKAKPFYDGNENK
jgi:hypothetical protein